MTAARRKSQMELVWTFPFRFRSHFPQEKKILMGCFYVSAKEELEALNPLQPIKNW